MSDDRIASHGAHGDAGRGAAIGAGPGDKATHAPGRRVQVRKQRETGWTKAKRALFLDHLAVTCNVTRSAHAAGIAPVNAYALKRRDPEFAALWRAALEAGYEHIETQLLARTIGQNPAELGESADADALASDDGAPFDPALALRVLAQRDAAKGHRPRGPLGKRVSIEEVRAVLLVKLAALNARLQRERAQAGRVALPAPRPAPLDTATDSDIDIASDSNSDIGGQAA